MRYSFQDDAALAEPLFALLDTVFPGVEEAARSARRLGASWESVSTPFIAFEDGEAVSHVGLIELSLVLGGHKTTVGTVHGVATHPRRRRRGHFRRLIEEVLEHSAGRYETLVLTTQRPVYFEPFGFRVVGERLHTVACRSPDAATGFRLLDPASRRDVRLLHRLLETREPVSDVVGVVDEKAIFFFNEGSRPLHYAAGLDVVVCMEREGTRLRLFDVVGPSVPPLAALLERIPWPVEEVAVCFGADRLAVDAEVTPYVFDHDGPSFLMVRGPFPVAGQAFTLPRSART